VRQAVNAPKSIPLPSSTPVTAVPTGGKAAAEATPRNASDAIADTATRPTRLIVFMP
jgi:hypothetical protein